MYFLYILRSLKDAKLYIGTTVDVNQRLLQHNNGQSKSTKYRRPFKLLYFEPYSSRSDAMKRLNLNQAIKDTKNVTSKMPDNNKWSIHTRFVELVEEVGELANAIQTTEGFKSKKRKKSEVVDSVCDVLFEILNIASYYKIDLDKEYPKVLKQIDTRRKSGEFDKI